MIGLLDLFPLHLFWCINFRKLWKAIVPKFPNLTKLTLFFFSGKKKAAWDAQRKNFAFSLPFF